MHGLENLVKRNDDKIDLVRRQLQPELQRQKRAGHGSRHGDFRPRQFRPAERRFGHQHRPVAVAHARPAGQQRVLGADVSVGVNADGRDVQFAPRGALIQRLDVLQNVLELRIRRSESIPLASP